MRKTIQTMDRALVQQCEIALAKKEQIELADKERRIRGYVETIEQVAPDLIEITIKRSISGFIAAASRRSARTLPLLMGMRAGH